jgi:hypothetical protein
MARDFPANRSPRRAIMRWPASYQSGSAVKSILRMAPRRKICLHGAKIRNDWPPSVDDLFICAHEPFNVVTKRRKCRKVFAGARLSDEIFRLTHARQHACAENPHETCIPAQ